MKKKQTFSYQSQVLTETILAEVDYFSKPVKKFLLTLFAQWWVVLGRHNFINMSRFMSYSEQALRNGFNRKIDFLGLNRRMIERVCSDELVIVFDPTFISKSGSHTQGLDWFWNGKEQRVRKGLELGCLSVIDLKKHTAFHLEAIQSPDSKERKKRNCNLLEHYKQCILQRSQSLKPLSKYVVVDVFFMKKNFVLPLVQAGFHVVTKMRSDANMKYLFNGQQKKGGRKRIHGDKVDFKKPQLHRWQCLMNNKEFAAYTAELYCVILKMNARIVYYQHKKHNTYEIILCTDLNLDAKKILQYYKLRFQVEFLIRDAKQHAGLEDCQARSKAKLNFHFNMALSSVSFAKAEFHLSTAPQKSPSFSLNDIKRFKHNQLLTNYIFSNLGLDLKCKKIKKIYVNCTNFGRMVA